MSRHTSALCTHCTLCTPPDVAIVHWHSYIIRVSSESAHPPDVSCRHFTSSDPPQHHICNQCRHQLPPMTAWLLWPLCLPSKLNCHRFIRCYAFSNGASGDVGHEQIVLWIRMYVLKVSRWRDQCSGTHNAGHMISKEIEAAHSLNCW